MEDLFISIILLSCIASLFVILKKVPRSKGLNIPYHILYLVCVLAVHFFAPESIHLVLFTHTGVNVIAAVVPIYESIKAIVSINDVDDIAWLQFWLISGIFTYCTEWMDVIAEHHPSIAEHWHEFEFFVILWLLLPFTDGSTLLFNKVTEPLMSPIAQLIKKQVESKMSFFFLIINSSFLWLVWFTFLSLEEEARRFIVITVGTLYPIAASTIACTSRTEERDDSFWLTYWVCFSILFLMMDYLEHFFGSIRGFYSMCLFATIYLFLPMFKGADVVFRTIIVPLSGQFEQMLLRDIHLLKLEMERKIPERKRDAAFRKAAAIFAKSKAD